MPWGPRREAWCLHPDPKRERPQGYLAAADDLEVAAASASASPHHARAQPAATPARSENAVVTIGRELDQTNKQAPRMGVALMSCGLSAVSSHVASRFLPNFTIFRQERAMCHNARSERLAAAWFTASYAP